MVKKYAIHPGRVKSKNDGQIHFISYLQLVRLYNLNPAECFLWDDRNPSAMVGKDPNLYKHLYPSYDGIYPDYGAGWIPVSG